MITGITHQNSKSESQCGIPEIFFTPNSQTTQRPIRIMISAQKNEDPFLPPAHSSSHLSSCLLSYSLGAPINDAPHLLQNLALSSFFLPHLEQYVIGSASLRICTVICIYIYKLFYIPIWHMKSAPQFYRICQQ